MPICHCLPIRLLIDIWLVSSIELLNLPRTLCTCLCMENAFISLRELPRSRKSGSNGRFVLNFLGYCQAVFQSGYRFSFPIAGNSSSCSKSLLMLAMGSIFSFSHCSKCIVVLFICTSIMANGLKHLFMWLICHVYIFFSEVSIENPLLIFSLGLLILLGSLTIHIF